MNFGDKIERVAIVVARIIIFEEVKDVYRYYYS